MILLNVELLKYIIISQREQMEELLQKGRIIEREIDLDHIKQEIKFPNVLAILGIRRSGKSVFTWLLMKGEKFGYINFFDERLSTLQATELSLVIQAFLELYTDIDYFVFDEIQRIEGWERFVSRIRTSKRIIITGSNSDLLRGNLSSFITGRHIDLTIFPFSFREFLKINDVEIIGEWYLYDDKRAMVKQMFNNFLVKGGFPEVQNLGTRILQEIFRDIIENDIISQHHIRNKVGIRNLSQYLASNISKEISFERLKRYLDIKNSHTVAKYVGYLEESYMFFLLQRFSNKLREQFIAPRKIYAIDTALANSISFRITHDQGRQFENIVFLELMRRNLYLGLNEELFYWKDHRGREVDFVIKRENEIIELIQVSSIIDEDDLIQRETDNLILCSNELKCENLKVITLDYEAEDIIKGKKIGFIPIWKWLF